MSRRRLLILSCSQRKRPDPAPLPALERYDGPAFRVLRRFLREHPTGAALLDSFVLSAEYGFIPGTQPILFYDRRLTAERAAELQPHVVAQLPGILCDAPYHALFVGGGKTYVETVLGALGSTSSGIAVTVASGSPGRLSAALRDWLWECRSIPVPDPD